MKVKNVVYAVQKSKIGAIRNVMIVHPNINKPLYVGKPRNIPAQLLDNEVVARCMYPDRDMILTIRAS